MKTAKPASRSPKKTKVAPYTDRQHHAYSQHSINTGICESSILDAKKYVIKRVQNEKDGKPKTIFRIPKHVKHEDDKSSLTPRSQRKKVSKSFNIPEAKKPVKIIN